MGRGGNFMHKILVIGGTGFIGMNIVNFLKEKSEYVSVYDLNASTYGCENYKGNITDDENFDMIISKYDTIIYLITSVSPKKSMENPTLSYTNDIPLLIRTLDACLKNNIKRVVFSSSGGTVYGDNNGEKSKESDFNEPINHYAICKLTSEKILEMYNKLYGMENIALRISNPYGEGQNPKSGIGAITVFIDQIINGQEINLFGDGSIIRDFIYVREVAEAFYLAMKWKYNSSIAPIFNIGSGEGLSLNEVIDIISKALSINPKINYLPKRPFDVKYNVLDIAKATQYLNFKPDEDESKYIYEYAKTFLKKEK
jgi:UDP-glucose 4-epimerase